jgi:hypothetical protein
MRGDRDPHGVAAGPSPLSLEPDLRYCAVTCTETSDPAPWHGSYRGSSCSRNWERTVAISETRTTSG